MTLREFSSADELRRHYRDLLARTRAWAPPPSAAPPPPAAPPPAPAAAKAYSPIRMTPMERIMRAVAEEFDTPLAAIRSRVRLATVVVPRQVAALLAHELTNMSNNKIGMFLGRRDHSTVFYAIATARHKIARDRTLAEKVQRLRHKLLEEDDERDEQDSERTRDHGPCGSDAAASGSAADCRGNGQRNL
jgi:Bacterial dnaA protein helix-turn-helix